MMESHGLLQKAADSILIRHRFPEPLGMIEKEIETPVSTNTRPRRQLTKPLDIADIAVSPWIGWLFVSSFLLSYFSLGRCIALKALVSMYGSPQAYTIRFKFVALTFGFMEDLICTIYFLCALWLFDTLKHALDEQYDSRNEERFVRIVRNIATFTISWFVFLIATVPFSFDLLLVINWNMRFTMDFLGTLIRERQQIQHVAISTEQYLRVYTTIFLLLTTATAFALVRICASWADLAHWNPTYLMTIPDKAQERNATEKVLKRAKYMRLVLQERQDVAEHGATDALTSVSKRRTIRDLISSHAVEATVVFVVLVVIPAAVVAIRHALSPLVVYAALNATVNELFGHALQPSAINTAFTNVAGNQPWIARYIHPTETHELFGTDSLYRRTTGFRGDLAFDVDVSNDNPPNVILVVIESFRFQDSRYMVGKEDPSNLFKGTNLTITPNFDRWAKRGVGIRNFWSSLPTSRSLESIMFGQVPYNRPVQTGITGGREFTQLAGLPQLFSGKGYETFFHTGSSITLDNWNIFLPTHGFDTVWARDKLESLAESHYNISRHDWNGPAKRGLGWGVHDDLSFELLGDLLVNKTNDQKERVANGKPKKPLFMAHYTISSHGPFNELPTWYMESIRPDFSELYIGEKFANDIECYYNARYFTDVQLGKFLDRMEKEGVLDDSIVVIMGDHGSAPELTIGYNAEEYVTRVPGVIIAEGRLGKDAGMLIEDAAEHYDILNTLADITGVPTEGFIQDGVGRSLKRKVPFGERVVYSNIPGRRMSVVRGHQRLRYDDTTDMLWVHNTETDHDMIEDLYPRLSPEQQAEWIVLREYGRSIATYYTQRWDNNCLLAINCTTTFWQ